MLTKHGVLSINGVYHSVILREIETKGGENPIAKVEIVNNPVTACRIKGMEVLKAIANSKKIKNVIFNNPATIVVWDDGTKTVVKCQPGDEYNRETGLAMCIAKKYLGNNGNFNEVFKKYIEDYDPRKK